MRFSDYKKKEGLASGVLAKFKKSPDHVLRDIKPSHNFSIGKGIESLIVDSVFRLNEFDLKFIVADLPKPPKEIIEAIDSGSRIMDLEVITKTGLRDKRYESRHAWMDVCSGHPGKIPMPLNDHHSMQQMLKNLMSMPLPTGDTVEEVIKLCEWQYPLFWETDGIKKKALVDLLIEVDNEVFIFDIKTCSSFGLFEKYLRKSYWIQDIHYQEGAHVCLKKTCHPMTFLVVEKKEPWIARPYYVEPVSRDFAVDRYNELCHDYAEWTAEGMPSVGWKGPKAIKV